MTQSIFDALAYMENLGEVLEPERLALAVAAQLAAQYYQAALASGGPPKLKAVLSLLDFMLADGWPPDTVVLVGSDVQVMDRVRGILEFVFDPHERSVHHNDLCWQILH